MPREERSTRQMAEDLLKHPEWIDSFAEAVVRERLKHGRTR